MCLLVATIGRGALRELADLLLAGQAAGSMSLDAFALGWYFCGDDITSDGDHVADVVGVAVRLRPRRLALLTGGWSEAVDAALAEGLAAAPALQGPRGDGSQMEPLPSG